MSNWFNGTASDDLILSKTDKLKSTKKGRSLFIITGSFALQYFDYRSVMRNPNFDTMIMNFGHLIPEAEKATWMFHGSIGYTRTFESCMTFKYFCESFQGSHVFMCQTKHCAGGAYPIAPKKSVIATLKNNNIKKWFLATHAYGDMFKKQSFGYIPVSLKHFSPSKIPWGCGGTLNAMALPFALQLGYSKIYMLGVGDKILMHYYDKELVQPNLRKQVTLPYRNIILSRYGKWNKLAKSSGTQLFVLPKKNTEEAIRKIFPCLDKI